MNSKLRYNGVQNSFHTRLSDPKHSETINTVLRSNIRQIDEIKQLGGTEACIALLDGLAKSEKYNDVQELALFWAAKSRIYEDAEDWEQARRILDLGESHLSFPAQKKILAKVFASFENRASIAAALEVSSLIHKAAYNKHIHLKEEEKFLLEVSKSSTEDAISFSERSKNDSYSSMKGFKECHFTPLKSAAVPCVLKSPMDATLPNALRPPFNPTSQKAPDYPLVEPHTTPLKSPRNSKRKEYPIHQKSPKATPSAPRKSPFGDTNPSVSESQGVQTPCPESRNCLDDDCFEGNLNGSSAKKALDFILNTPELAQLSPISDDTEQVAIHEDFGMFVEDGEGSRFHRTDPQKSVMVEDEIDDFFSRRNYKGPMFEPAVDVNQLNQPSDSEETMHVSSSCADDEIASGFITDKANGPFMPPPPPRSINRVKRTLSSDPVDENAPMEPPLNFPEKASKCKKRVDTPTVRRSKRIRKTTGETSPAPSPVKPTLE